MWLALSIGGLAWVISIALAVFFGRKWSNILVKLKDIEQDLDKRLSVKKEQESPKPQSSIIDPTDIAQRAQFEQDEIQRRLNT